MIWLHFKDLLADNYFSVYDHEAAPIISIINFLIECQDMIWYNFFHAFAYRVSLLMHALHVFLCSNPVLLLGSMKWENNRNTSLQPLPQFRIEDGLNYWLATVVMRTPKGRTLGKWCIRAFMSDHGMCTQMTLENAFSLVLSITKYSQRGFPDS